MTQKALRLLTGLLVVAFAAVPAGADPTDDFIGAQMREFHLPGLSLAVSRNGEIVKAAGYGLADPERQIAAAPDTVYKIGSISKQFIATAVVLLARDGRLRLDDAVDRFLPDVPAGWRPITIRHLLTHTGGLVRESPAFQPFKVQTDAALIKAAYQQRLRFPPGEKWEYSNLGYVVLAEIVARAAGKPWTEYIHDRIFVPAGLTATAPTNVKPRPPLLAFGYGGDDNRRKADDWPALRASGAFLSTVLDLAKWDAILYTDRVLTEAERRTVWTPVQLNSGTAAPYGLGWHIHEEGRWQRRLWHGGGLPGFVSHIARYVDHGLTVIALTNGEDADMYTIVTGVAKLHMPAIAAAAAGTR